MSPLSLMLLAGLGLIVGGLINILADDLPHRRRPRLPRYRDDTHRPLAAWLGVMAFVTGHRTSPTGWRLSWRYPLVEIITALAFIGISLMKADVVANDGLQLVFWLYLMAVFVLIVVIDVEHHLILFVVIIPSCGIAILDTLMTTTPPTLERAMLGAGIGFGTFFLLYLGGVAYVYLSNQLAKRGIDEVAFGFGDVMLAILCGLVLGLEPMIFAMFITVFLGALGAMTFLVIQRISGGEGGLYAALPYGPYIVAGTLIMLLFGPQVRFLIAGY